MKRERLLSSITVIACLFATSVWSQSIKPTLISQNVSLASGNSSITYVKLMNTRSRTYEHSASATTFTVKGKGVFWTLQCIGVKIEDPFKRILLKNERGEVFEPVTGMISTSERSKGYDDTGAVIYDGPSTTFLLIGADDSKTVEITFGRTSAKLTTSK